MRAERVNLFLVRHGETEANRQGLALGRADVPLNENGRKQATQLSAALSGDPIVAVYSSPLVRAVETAGPIAATHQQLPVQIEPRLIEMDIGDLDGLTFAQVRERYPRLLELWTSAEGPRAAMPGGERLQDVQRRATEAMELIAKRHSGGGACLVTHNFVILAILADVLGIDLSGFRRLRHNVAAITTLELSRGRWRIVRLNDACHLRD